MKRQYPKFYLTIYPLAFFAFGFWLLPAPNIYGWLPHRSPALSLILVFGFLTASNFPGCFPSIPRAFFFFGFWASQPQILVFACLLTLTFSFWGFTCPIIAHPPVGCPPNAQNFCSFSVLGFYSPRIPSGRLPSQPLRFLCFQFLGFYPHQFPRVDYLSSPALSFFSVCEFYPPHIPSSGWLPSIPPNFFLFFEG